MARDTSRWAGSSSGLGSRGKTLRPSRVIRNVWRPGRSACPRILVTLSFRTTEVSLNRLIQHDEAVGHGEDRMVFTFRSRKLADEEGRRLPGGEVNGQPLDEVLHVQGARLGSIPHPQHRAEGVHDDKAGGEGVDLTHEALENRREAALYLSAQRAEADHAVHLRRIEEAVLLLVPEHVERRLADDREVEARTISCRVGEHDLVGQGRLAGAGRADDEVEGQLREAFPQHVVQPWTSGCELPWKVTVGSGLTGSQAPQTPRSSWAGGQGRTHRPRWTVSRWHRRVGKERLDQEP